MSFFSIIVPIYKIPDDYLRNCLDSIINQTFKDYELILVDDESPDNCGKICDEYRHMYDNIQVLHQKNQGVSVARNNGMLMAKGEWIVFVDGDDWLENNYLETFYNMIKDTEADIYISSCFINYANAQVINPFFCEEELVFEEENKDRAILQFLCKNIYNDNLGTADVGAPWAKVYRRKFLIENDLVFNPELLRMQDNIFNLYAFQYANKIFYKNIPIYHYRKSEFSGFSRFNPHIIKYYEKVFDIIQNFNVVFEKSAIFNDALNIKIINSFYVYLKLYYFHKDNYKRNSVIKKEIYDKLSEKIYHDALNNYKAFHLDNKEKIFARYLKKRNVLGLRLLMKGKDLFYKLSKRNI